MAKRQTQQDRMARYQRLALQNMMQSPEENSTWEALLPAFDVVTLPGEAWVALCALCVDDPQKLLKFLELVLSKNISPLELVPVLRLFYFTNSTDAELRQSFYQKFKLNADENPESALAQLYQLAKTHFLKLSCYSNSTKQKDKDNSNGAIYYSLNLLEESVCTGAKKISCQDHFNYQYAIDVDLVLSSWKILWSFFSKDLLSVIAVDSEEVASKLFQQLYALSKENHLSYSELLSSIQEQDSMSRSQLLNAMSKFYSNPDEFSHYLNIASQYPSFLFLINSKNFSNEQHKAIGKLSERTFEAMVQSKIFKGHEKLFHLYLVLNVIGHKPLSYRISIKGIVENGMIDLLLELGQEQDAVDPTVINFLKKQKPFSRLYSCMLARVNQWQQELINMVDDFSHLVLLWRSHEAERTFIKSLFPNIRYSGYPYDIHELTAFFFRQRFFQNNMISLKENVWPIVTGELYSHIADVNEIDEYWRRALAVSFVVTHSSEIRRQIVILLNAECKLQQANNDEVAHWWLPPFWPVNTNALEAFKSYHGIEKLNRLHSDLINLPHNVEIPVTLLMKQYLHLCNADLVKELLIYIKENSSVYSLSKILNEVFQHFLRKRDLVEINNLLVIIKQTNNQSNLDISVLLEAFVKGSQWDIVKYLLSLIEISQPRLQSLKLVFEHAAKEGKLEIVAHILSMQHSSSFEKAFIHQVVQAAAEKFQWRVVQHLLTATHFKRANRRLMKKVLTMAAKDGAIELANIILSKKWYSWPVKISVNRALYAAAHESQWELVKHLLAFTGFKKPSRRIVEDTLLLAATVGQGDVVKQILAMNHFNKPRKSTIRSVLLSGILEKYPYPYWDIKKDLLNALPLNKHTIKVFWAHFNFAAGLSNPTIVLHILDRFKNTEYYPEAINNTLYYNVARGVGVNLFNGITRYLSSTGGKVKWNYMLAIINSDHFKNARDTEINSLLSDAIDANEVGVIRALLLSLRRIGDRRIPIVLAAFYKVVLSGCVELLEVMLNRLKDDDIYQEVLREIYDYVLHHSVSHESKWQMVKYFLTSEHVDFLSDCGMNLFLLDAIKAEQWEVVHELISSNVADQLDENMLTSALKLLLDNAGLWREQLGLAREILLLKSSHNQNTAQFNYELLDAAVCNRNAAIKDLFEKPDRAEADPVVLCYVIWHVLNINVWTLLDFLFTQPEMEMLEPETFRQLFHCLIERSRWDFAAKLLEKNKHTVLTKKDFDEALIQVVSNSSELDARRQFMKSLFQGQKVVGACPSVSGVASAFTHALTGSRRLLTVFFEFPKAMQPKTELLNTAIQVLSGNSQWKQLFDILNLASFKPDQSAIDYALEKAVIVEDLDAVKSLLNYKCSHQMPLQVVKHYDKRTFYRKMNHLVFSCWGNHPAKQLFTIFSQAQRVHAGKDYDPAASYQPSTSLFGPFSGSSTSSSRRASGDQLGSVWVKSTL